MKTKLIIFAVLCFTLGCASTAGKKAASSLSACDEKYENIEKIYIYPQDLQNCHSRALKLDLHFIPMDSVKAYKPGMEEMVFEAKYDKRPYEENKQIYLIEYFDANIKTKEVIFIDNSDRPIAMVLYYSPQSAQAEKAYFYLGTLPARAQYYAKNALPARVPYYAKTEEEIRINSAGLIEEYILGGFVRGKSYHFKLNEFGRRQSVSVFEYIKTPNNCGSEDIVQIDIGKAYYNDDGSLNSYGVRLFQKQLPKLEHGKILHDTKRDELIVYDSKGSVLCFKCKVGDCLKYNGDKPWMCGTICHEFESNRYPESYGEITDCAQKSGQLRYTFEEIPLEYLNIPPTPSKEYLQSKIPPDVCALGVINFQCPKK